MATTTRTGGGKPRLVDPEDLLGVAEVAAIAGVSRQAVTNWRGRDVDFPAPVLERAMGPLFLRADVAKWLEGRK